MAETDFVRDRILVPLVICFVCVGLFLAYSAITREERVGTKTLTHLSVPSEKIAADVDPILQQSLTREHFSSSEKWIDYIFGIYKGHTQQFQDHLNDGDVLLIENMLADEAYFQKWNLYCQVLGHLGVSDKSSEIILAFVQRNEPWEQYDQPQKKTVVLAKLNAIGVLGLTRGLAADKNLKELTTVEGTALLMERWEVSQLQELFRRGESEIKRRIRTEAFRGVALTNDANQPNWLTSEYVAMKDEFEGLRSRLKSENNPARIEEVELALESYWPLNYGVATSDLVDDIGMNKYLGFGWSSTRLDVRTRSNSMGWPSSRLDERIRPYAMERWDTDEQVVQDLRAWVRATKAGMTVEEYEIRHPRRQQFRLNSTSFGKN
jgi:hypothetical protein